MCEYLAQKGKDILDRIETAPASQGLNTPGRFVVECETAPAWRSTMTAILPKIDASAFIAPGAFVVGRVTVGPGASVWYNAVIRGDSEVIVISDESNIQDLAMVHADPGFPCVVGKRVSVGHRVILHGCTVEDGCLIGMGAVVLNGVRVGMGSVIGAGAVLVEGMEVPPGSLVLGVPARIVRPVDESMRGRIDHAWRHYVSQAKRHGSGAFPIERPSPESSGGM
jgi:carbonic anhydrase/acetyltransferase-like protein (isoleucine patch superfamily)